MNKLAEVIVSISHENVDKIFHYIIPLKLENEIQIGMRVTVPFGMGNKKIDGYIIGFSNESDVSFDKLKEIISISEEYPVFSLTMINLAKWLKVKCYTSLSECLKCILPSGLGMSSLSVKHVYLNYELHDFANLLAIALKKNDKQSLVLNELVRNDGQPIKILMKKINISESPIKTLEKNNYILFKPFAIFRNPIKQSNYIKMEHLKLNSEQQIAFERLKINLNEPNKKPVLLFGVTGSGKTEVYLQIINEVLKSGKQAIMLVPEISLTPQTIRHFVGRFGELVSVTHSRLSQGERFDQWRKARENKISVMIGPRSAIFTPFDNLGIIIIDEEHENTYKSETTPKYDVKDIAKKMMELTNCSVVLGTATPSIETYYRATIGEIEILTLNERVNKKMPTIEIIDMREELANGNRSIFGKDLFYAIKNNLEKGNQTILFMNRRGHSTFVSCRACGNVLACDLCSINYTYHIYSNKMLCHYCGKEEVAPKVCPVCGSKHIKYFGVGTQKVEEELIKYFPTARVLRMDMDTTSAKHGHELILSQFANKQADILIGTQMIAKGHDFPSVSLVGIIAADLSLNTGDYRSAETTYQLISQVSGRAGRASLDGKVYIQTYNPEHYSIIYSSENNYEQFYNHEIAIRKQMEYPPFTNIFNILFTGESEKKIIVALSRLSEIMRYYNKKEQFEVLGPAPAQISKINKNYRWKIFVKCNDEQKIISYVFYCLNKLKKSEDISGITINVSLNPTMLA